MTQRSIKKKNQLKQTAVYIKFSNAIDSRAYFMHMSYKNFCKIIVRHIILINNNKINVHLKII